MAAELPDWMLARAEEEAIEIDEKDADVVALFMSLDTQWRVHPMSGARLGLDYGAVRATAELFDIAMPAGMASDLRVMEIAALEQMAADSRRTGR